MFWETNALLKTWNYISIYKNSFNDNGNHNRKVKRGKSKYELILTTLNLSLEGRTFIKDQENQQKHLYKLISENISDPISIVYHLMCARPGLAPIGFLSLKFKYLPRERVPEIVIVLICWTINSSNENSLTLSNLTDIGYKLLP